MARKRTIDRGGQRAEFDEDEEKVEEEEQDEEEESDEDEDAEAEDDDEAGDDEEEEKPKPVKKPPKKKPAAPKRTRAAKVVRLRAIWVVFDNASKQIETFPYNQKSDAERFVVEKNTDKKGYYLQMVKVPLEEKEKEK